MGNAEGTAAPYRAAMSEAWWTLRAASHQVGLPVEVLFGAVVRGQLRARQEAESAGWLVEPSDVRRFAAELDADGGQGLPGGEPS